MKILRFEPEMAAGVAQCYNELVAAVPHCAPVTAEAFAAMEPLAHRHARDDEMLVAREANGDILGFVHLAIASPPTEDWHPADEPGLIRFLSYRPGQRAVGQALLDAAQRRVRDRSRPGIIAWSNDYVYSFYHLPFAHLSDRIGHMHPLLALAGYQVLRSELLFDWEDFHPPTVVRPDLNLDICLDVLGDASIGPKMMPGLAVRAMRGGQQVGVCETGRPGPGSSLPGARGWCFCRELNVEESLRGRGLGKFLLATGLAEMKKAGCRHAAISTDWDNYRAALFYANFGYRLIDRTFSFRKELREEGAAR